MGMIQKQGYWVPCELKPRDVEPEQVNACEELLERQRRKAFLHGIVTRRKIGNQYRTELMRLCRALKDKRPQYAERYAKLILKHDNARPYVAKVFKIYLETLKWEVLPHSPFSSDVAPSVYQLFGSMHMAWLTNTFSLMEKSENGQIRGSPQKMTNIFDAGFVHCPKNG
ncbi:unnamed protein product [Euphydryas editha]|uniref:Reverse transcriptase n=1 Tax=Euphydryas editha TaxID=104508 RepID=A0AAU9UKB7_EUPED|nr:unnamed protein product [Euphydryas editha]